jgi:hypothetical protein
VPKLFWIVVNEVPARKLKAANLSQHLFSIHGLEVFLLGLVRRESKRHLPFDHRDSSVSQADLIAGIDAGSIADSRSVGQIPSRHIGLEPDGGVVAARGVAKERIEAGGGVGDARGVAIERLDSAGGVVNARGVATEGTVSACDIIIAYGVVIERLDSVGGVGDARGVATEGIVSTGRVVAARGVATERIKSAAVLKSPVVFKRRALSPLAVL